MRIFHLKFGLDWPSGFREFEHLNKDDSDDGACVYYKLTL